MGAANALKVYATYGGVLGDQAIRVLTYMAIVARDQDSAPWFGLGHEALSELALSRPVPSKEEDRKGHDEVLRRLRRVITELRKAGAIVTISGPTNNGGHVRYRLFLDRPHRPGSPVDNPLSETPRPVDNPHVVGQKVTYDQSRRRSLSGQS